MPSTSAFAQLVILLTLAAIAWSGTCVAALGETQVAKHQSKAPTPKPKTPSPSPSAQTFEVTVGLVSPQGAGINAFFPPTLAVHPGDTVVFLAGSPAMQTATFTLNHTFNLVPFMPAPGIPNAFMLNPLGTSQAPLSGFTFTGKERIVSSGILATGNEYFYASYNFTVDPNLATPAKFQGLSVPHYDATFFELVVEPPSKPIASTSDVAKLRKALISAALAKALITFDTKVKTEHVPKSVKLPGGRTHHFVVVANGADVGKLDSDFFEYHPRSLTVKRGDLITWVQSPSNSDVPHTVTFLAPGQTRPNFVMPVNLPSVGYVYLFAQALAPVNVDRPITGQEMWSSGIIQPQANITAVVNFTG